MAKFSYKCSTCGRSKQIYTSVKTQQINCDCGDTMDRQLPTLNGSSQVTETVDDYLNIKWIPDQREILEKRRDKHFWTHIVPRLVESGIYSIETMVEHQWITLNEKNEIIINSKPPDER